MGRRFITARDIDDVVAEGGAQLRVDAGDRLTDLARERARDRGIAIIEAGAASSASRSARATSAGAPAPAPTSASAGGPGPSSGAGGPGAAAGPTVASSGATPGAVDEDGPPRRALRAAVRAGVVGEFGGTPDGLDAAIGRVFDRLGISD